MSRITPQSGSIHTKEECFAYTIRAGDTLSGIARRTGLSLESILQLNPALRDHPDTLYAGRTMLHLPAGARAVLEPAGSDEAGQGMRDAGLSLGDTGHEVVRLKSLLNAVGYEPALDQDGEFDVETQRAVTWFQKTFQIYDGPIHGRADADTMNALSQEATAQLRSWATLDIPRDSTTVGLTSPSAKTGVSARNPARYRGVDVMPRPAPAVPDDWARAVDDTSPLDFIERLDRALTLGRKGEDVRQLQRALNRSGATLEIDGDFGTGTQHEVLRFQERHGLSVDGVVGPNTWRALLNAAVSPHPHNRVQFRVSVDALGTPEQRVAYDVLRHLAYDDPKTMDVLYYVLHLRTNASSRGRPITLRTVDALVEQWRHSGLPLNADAARVLRSIDGRDDGRLGYHGARAVAGHLHEVSYRGGGLPVTSNYDHVIRDAAARYGVPYALARSVTYRESGFDPNARSAAGAVGLMQLMEATAAEVGVSDRYNPEQNVEGGVKYLAWLHRMFGNWPQVIAAYNAGPTRTARHALLELPVETIEYTSRNAISYLVFGGDAEHWLVRTENALDDDSS